MDRPAFGKRKTPPPAAPGEGPLPETEPELRELGRKLFAEVRETEARREAADAADERRRTQRARESGADGDGWFSGLFGDGDGGDAGGDGGD